MNSVFSVAVVTVSSMVIMLGTFTNVLGQEPPSSSTDCLDYQECFGNFVSTDEINCHGYYGCQSASIDVTTTNINGAHGCHDARINSNTINAFGTRALDSAEVQVNNLLGYGYFGAIYSNISALDSSLDVDFAGLYGGYMANIYCYAGDTCTIECGSARGCQSLDFYCFSGSTCYYNCNDDANNCPTLFGGIGAHIFSVIKPSNSNSVNYDSSESGTRAISSDANSHELGESGLSFNSKTGLSDEKMAELLDARIAKREEMVAKEIETGEIDSKLIESVTEYFESKSIGDDSVPPNEVVTELFNYKLENNNIYHNNKNNQRKGNGYFSSKTVSYIEGVVHTLLAVLILAILVRFYEKWSQKINKLLGSCDRNNIINRNKNNVVDAADLDCEYQIL